MDCSIHKGKRDDVVQLYHVEWRTPLTKGADGIIKITSYYTRILFPYPAEISQYEEQTVLFTASHLFLSPYASTIQTTTVKLPSSKVKDYSKIPPMSLKGSTLIYGPYEDVPTYSSLEFPKSLTVHFKSHAPFLTMTHLTKEIQVSMWGRVTIEEVVDLEHTGARLKGGFSRLDYDASSKAPRRAHGRSSFQSMSAILPKDATDVYYRDEIGNITTSHMRETPFRTEVELQARYPLFGGWKTQYVLGYSVPTTSVLYRQSSSSSSASSDTKDQNYRANFDHYKLDIAYATCVDGAAVDTLTLKVILPAGSTNVRVVDQRSLKERSSSSGYLNTTATWTMARRQSFLDTSSVGCPVVILQTANVISQHNHDEPLLVTFDLERQSLFRKPLVLISTFFTIFLVFTCLVRVDLSLT